MGKREEAQSNNLLNFDGLLRFVTEAVPLEKLLLSIPKLLGSR